MTDPTRTARPPGMLDVARLAGVSTQTVSRTLRGHAYVKEETRRKVMNAVASLGYRMNPAAQALSSGRTRTIGVVTMATGAYAGAVTQMGIERAAESLGYHVVGAQTATVDPDAVSEALRRLERHGVEGLVLALPLGASDGKIDALIDGVPTVTIGGSTTASGHSLAVDQQRVARLATEHLLDLGHQTVHLVAGPDDWIDAANRTTGWQHTLTEAGRPSPEPLHGDWSPESGYQAGLQLGADPGVTAVFVATDDMAFGLIRALHELGRRVPDDVSVVGVDDIDLAAYCSPALTTIAQPFTALAAAAVQRVVALIGGDGASAPVAGDPARSLQPELVIRASTAPPPPSATLR